MSEHDGRYSNEATSIDELAKGLAAGTVSRRKALRLMGAALVGGALASIPGVALAASAKCGGQTCTAPKTACIRGSGKPRCGCPSCPVPVMNQDPDTCRCGCPICLSPKVQDPNTCECACPNTCGELSIGQDPDTCECNCALDATCPTNYVLNRTTCTCEPVQY